MNSMINGSRLLAAALCAAVLAGCNAVERRRRRADCRGSCGDRSTRRSYQGSEASRRATGPAGEWQGCLLGTGERCGPQQPEDHFGVPIPRRWQSRYSAFSFSAINAEGLPRLRVGDAYSITVKRQPYGKVCTVAEPDRYDRRK